MGDITTVRVAWPTGRAIGAVLAAWWILFAAFQIAVAGFALTGAAHTGDWQESVFAVGLLAMTWLHGWFTRWAGNGNGLRIRRRTEPSAPEYTATRDPV